jgi:hypothetical protein
MIIVSGVEIFSIFFHCNLKSFFAGGILAFRWSSSEVVRHSHFSRAQVQTRVANPTRQKVLNFPAGPVWLF